nr:immunoglobulin heavy chain junction region [Macaca mulatta]MOV38478.1 immunoglobulin heavy chain junction region [Macaca mulatta]MOV38670.1 immunoglobulin heavy chain junction region [Macaca mulatta]MOV39330.1 immunoglobulin heavy chain junction region [Macaca mulatta]MOV39794.1 immunoglobulin heavy chain junction region [Macaca mulatta]
CARDRIFELVDDAFDIW